jgi:hypothetical protein
MVDVFERPAPTFAPRLRFGVYRQRIAERNRKMQVHVIREPKDFPRRIELVYGRKAGHHPVPRITRNLGCGALQKTLSVHWTFKFRANCPSDFSGSIGASFTTTDREGEHACSATSLAFDLKQYVGCAPGVHWLSSSFANSGERGVGPRVGVRRVQ